MVPEKCQHPKRVRGVVELDFRARRLQITRFTPGRSPCTYVKTARFHHELCDWLRKS